MWRMDKYLRRLDVRVSACCLLAGHCSVYAKRSSIKCVGNAHSLFVAVVLVSA